MRRLTSVLLSLLACGLVACGSDPAAPAVAATDIGSGVAGDSGGAVDTSISKVDTSDPGEDAGGQVVALPDFGAPCVQNTDCASEYCVVTDQGHVCSQSCFDECPGDFVCRQAAGTGSDVAFICVPRAAHVCSPCFDDAQCFGGLCAAVPGDAGRFCLAPCDGADDTRCPTGHACTEEGGAWLCRPTTGSCTCGYGSDGALRTCQASSELGVCIGTQTCDRTQGWSACSAAPATAETCDGVDEDCDGVVDNGLAAPACSVALGVCAGAHALCGGTLGWLACDGAVFGPDYDPVEVRCDGKDNDCDGTTDNVDLDKDGHVAAECGGDDCDDHSPVVHAGLAEFCGDGLDNDCDGTADNLDHDGDGLVAVACGGDDCNDLANLAFPGGVEICGNGLDDDCSGGIDDLDADGDGFVSSACGGKDCDDGADVSFPGAPEQCNTKDDDCNGVTDEKDDDGDGHIDLACGGDDCDDGDEAIRPAVLELCGNTVDEDCSGALDDRDRDHDGHVDASCGGDDCDDVDLLVYTGATELYDTKDSDCDGTVDEGLVTPGTVLITELGIAPGAVSTAAGQWVEVTNVGVLPVNLASMTVSAVGSSVGQGTLPASPPIVVASGGAAVLCVNTDPAANGGIPCDGVLPVKTLGASGGGVAISLAGVELDRVALTTGAGFLGTAPTGATYSLDPNQYTAAGNDVGGNWCPAPASAALPSGDRGSPGAPNPSCSGAPAVILVAPSSGVDNGGESITITGSGFTAAASVSVGGSPCSSFVVVSDTSITCTTPAGVAGPADVVVVKGGLLGTAKSAYRYTGEAVKKIDWCDIQFPTAISGKVGASSGVLYGRVHSPGVTEVAGAPVGIEGQLGYGPQGSDPRNDPGWVWFPATWNPTCGGEPCGPNKEYYAVVNPSAAGTFSLAYRYSDDAGTNFMVCDLLPGTADGFSPGKLAVLTVTP